MKLQSDGVTLKFVGRIVCSTISDFGIQVQGKRMAAESNQSVEANY